MAAHTTSEKPPGFKDCEPCSECVHWDGKDECLLYHYPAEDDNSCDSFKAIAEGDDIRARLWKAHRRRLERQR
jgi:hypothetical protein